MLHNWLVVRLYDARHDLSADVPQARANGVVVVMGKVFHRILNLHS